MKSVLIKGLIVNHESPISSSDTEVEYKIIGLKGIDLYTLSGTELSIQETATRVISCKYKFETDEYSIVVRYVTGTRNIFSVYIKSVSDELLQDIYNTRTVVYNANLDVMFNGNSEPIRFSLFEFVHIDFRMQLNKVALELRILPDYAWYSTDFSFVRPTDELISIVRDYILTKVSIGLYRYGDTIIAFKDYDDETLIIPDDISEIVIDSCKSLKNLVLNKCFKSIECNYLEKLSRLAVSRSLSYKQFSDVALEIMLDRGISSNSIAEYYEKSNYKACFDLFQSDKELAESVFGDIDIIVY